MFHFLLLFIRSIFHVKPVSAEQITFIIFKKMYLGIVVFSVAAILRVGIINNHIQ